MQVIKVYMHFLYYSFRFKVKSALLLVLTAELSQEVFISFLIFFILTF